MPQLLVHYRLNWLAIDISDTLGHGQLSVGVYSTVAEKDTYSRRFPNRRDIGYSLRSELSVIANRRDIDASLLNTRHVQTSSAKARLGIAETSTAKARALVSELSTIPKRRSKTRHQALISELTPIRGLDMFVKSH